MFVSIILCKKRILSLKSDILPGTSFKSLPNCVVTDELDPNKQSLQIEVQLGTRPVHPGKFQRGPIQQ